MELDSLLLFLPPRKERQYNIAEKNLSDNAKIILRDRYLARTKNGKILENFDDCFLRVSFSIAQGARQYGKDDEYIIDLAYLFYLNMASCNFLPNSPTIVNAGAGEIVPNTGNDEEDEKNATDFLTMTIEEKFEYWLFPYHHKGSNSACYVISPDDSLESIMDTATEWALTEKSGGGIGAGFNKIRPKNDKIRSTHGNALGVLSIMDILSNNAKHITAGSFRLGAHMSQLSCDHPEIFDFIHAKDTLKGLENFNISVQITDKFMDRLNEGEKYSGDTIVLETKDGKKHYLNSRDIIIVDGKETMASDLVK